MLLNELIFVLFDIKAVEGMYPAMNIARAFLNKDSLKLKFLKNVLEKCQYVRVLIIKCRKDKTPNYERVDRILGLMSSNLLGKITCLSLTREHSAPPYHGDPLAILIDDTDPDTLHKYLNILLPKYNLLKRNPLKGILMVWLPRMCRRFLKFAYVVVRVCMGKCTCFW